MCRRWCRRAFSRPHSGSTCQRRRTRGRTARTPTPAPRSAPRRAALRSAARESKWLQTSSDWSNQLRESGGKSRDDVSQRRYHDPHGGTSVFLVVHNTLKDREFPLFLLLRRPARLLAICSGKFATVQKYEVGCSLCLLALQLCKNILRRQ